MLSRLAAAALVLGVCCACRETDVPVSSLVTGSGPVAVTHTAYVGTGDGTAALGSAAAVYVVCTVDLTDDQPVALVPVITHFTLTDRSGARYTAVDTGSIALTGISNDLRPMRPGEKRTFTFGFRAVGTTMGTIRYEY